MTFAWQPGSHYNVAATRGPDNVLASDCRAQFGRPSTRRGFRICVTVRLPVRPRGETMLGPATTQNLVVKFDGEICGGVLVENASDDFPQQKKLENLLETSPEVRHQFRRKLRQLHSGNRWCLQCTGKQMRIPPFPLPPF